MKRHVAICVAALLGAASQSQAATIIWGSPTAINSESDVSLNGTTVMARQSTGSPYGGQADQTVNGVLFSGSANTQGGVTFSLDSGFSGYDPNSYVLGAAGTPGTLSTAYQTMLTGAWFGSGGSGAFSLTGLTVGQEYQLQIWVADYRQFPPNVYSRSQTFTSGSTSGPLTYLQTNGSGINLGASSGSYILGQFTADNATQTINLFSADSQQLNAFQLRAVPEPASLGLVGLGIAAAGWRRLRRRR